MARLFLVLLGTVWLGLVSAHADEIRDFKWEETLDPSIVEDEMAQRIRRAPNEPESFQLRIHIAKLGYVAWRLETKDAARRLQLAEIVVRYARQAVVLDENHAAGHHWVGVGLAMAGVSRGVMNSLQLVPAVRQSFERSAELDPSYLWASAYTQLGRMYAVLPGFPVSIGSRSQAAEYFAKARELAPDESLPLLYLADLYWQSRQPEQALSAIETLLSMEPDNPLQFFSHTMSSRKAKEMRELIQSGKAREPMYDVTTDFRVGLVR